MSLATAPMDRLMRIKNLRGNGATTLRLMEMGVVEGAEVSVLRRAPLGDPLHVRIGDCELSLRGQQADLIDVEPV